MITFLVNGVDVASAPSVTLNSGHLFAPLRSSVVRLVDRVEIVQGSRIILTRGNHRLLLCIGSYVAEADGVTVRLAAAPYQSGTEAMIPLRVVVNAMHERMKFDTVRQAVSVMVPPTAFSMRFTPAPPARVAPSVVFTPRPAVTPAPTVTPVRYPRRTPIPVRLDPASPPL